MDARTTADEQQDTGTAEAVRALDTATNHLEVALRCPGLLVDEHEQLTTALRHATAAHRRLDDVLRAARIADQLSTELGWSTTSALTTARTAIAVRNGSHRPREFADDTAMAQAIAAWARRSDIDGTPEAQRLNQARSSVARAGRELRTHKRSAHEAADALNRLLAFDGVTVGALQVARTKLAQAQAAASKSAQVLNVVTYRQLRHGIGIDDLAPSASVLEVVNDHTPGPALDDAIFDAMIDAGQLSRRPTQEW